MASDRRASISSAHSAMSRSSYGASRPQAPQLGPLPTPSPLAAGTAIASPTPPLPPLKDRLPPPMTPQRKPVLRQKSPLSSEAFSSPASSMPGAFPSTPSPPPGLATNPYQNEAYASGPSPGTPDSKASKRRSGIRGLLSFKALRRSYSNTAPDSPEPRPKTPGAESFASSTRPSLRKKMSGSFWRRSSSLGTSFTAGNTGEGLNGYSGSPGLNGGGDDSIIEEEAPRQETPVPGESSPIVSKRKSGTFWRRKSSLSLANALDNEKVGLEKKPVEEDDVHGAEYTNGNGNADISMGAMQRKESKELPPPPPRSISPPPQLPPLIGGGGGLGGADLFKDIQ